MIQESVLAAPASQTFDLQKMPPISNRRHFLHRLRLIKILSACFAKSRFLNHFRYSRKKWNLLRRYPEPNFQPRWV